MRIYVSIQAEQQDVVRLQKQGLQKKLHPGKMKPKVNHHSKTIEDVIGEINQFKSRENPYKDKAIEIDEFVKLLEYKRFTIDTIDEFCFLAKSTYLDVVHDVAYKNYCIVLDCEATDVILDIRKFLYPFAQLLVKHSTFLQTYSQEIVQSFGQKCYNYLQAIVTNPTVFSDKDNLILLMDYISTDIEVIESHALNRTVLLQDIDNAKYLSSYALPYKIIEQQIVDIIPCNHVATIDSIQNFMITHSINTTIHLYALLKQTL